MRVDGRQYDQLRHIHMETDYIKHPEGSVLITVGDTKVICNASVEDRVPPFMRGEGKGWVTAEYAMLPRATEQRNIRESSKGKISGRTMEIQRLIGRSLRAVVDLEKIGERTVWVDCDVIQADGGTRTASITGAFVAMTLAFGNLICEEVIQEMPITNYLAAISVGVLPDGKEILDLCYEEDSEANVDMNIVMTGEGEYVELQGTGEEATFTPDQLKNMLILAEKGLKDIFQIQREAIGEEWHELIQKNIEQANHEENGEGEHEEDHSGDEE
ncbi:RNAse PH [Melghiribacillus thermohalophilus]|uniref:Ribonuclease PH n=1 Tax=Melghiribacillus thermohalophilus TaxID=1324956 RepID=A0A4R3N710_9BACI|nr:ribonuclease PH [Melghiribacillus thermohalophilus]TCT25070.1 RNAse PH [Melghiribacillus thermohalophilus]